MRRFFTTLLFLLIWSVFFVVCSGQSGDWETNVLHRTSIQRQTTYACQYSILELSCSQHHVIRISRANYGRFSRRLCNPQGLTNLDLQCKSNTAVQVISANCDGHRYCQVAVNDTIFEDPCPGTLKYVEVQHYCEPAKSEEDNDSGLKPFPDGDRPRPLVVPVPENLQVCVLPISRGSMYDMAWEMPEFPLTVMFFNIMYKVNGETRVEDVTNATPLDGRKYMYAFKPQEKERSFSHQFAVRAHTLSAESEYSQFVSPRYCRFDEDGNYVPLDSMETTTTSTTSYPKDGGGLRQMCSPVTVYGVRWPETAPGDVRNHTCPPRLGGKGMMYYKCLSDGQWDRNGPETDKCFKIITTTTTTTTTTTSTTTTTTSTPVKQDAPKPVSFSDDVTSRLQNLAGPGGVKRDKYVLSTFLPSVTETWSEQIDFIRDPRKKKALADDFKESMLGLSDALLDDDSAWNNMSVKEQRHAAASVLDSVETSGLLAASAMPVGATNITRKSNVVMKVMNMDTSLGQAAVLDDKVVSGPRAKVNRFTIPPGVLEQVARYRKEPVPVVFVVMSDISEWLTPEIAPTPVNDNVIDARPQEEPPRKLVNTDVISVSVSRGRVKNLLEPVVFLLEHRQTESVENAQCSFWDTDLGGWSTEGCELVHSNKTHTTCKCNHLTSFAVLMDITGSTMDLSASVRLSLELITYIGCAISIVCLLLSWVTFTCFKNLDCDRNTIHKHLVFCLMVAQIVLVAGLQQTQPPVLCSVIAGVLHFFFLASFAWMCLEGVQLYVMLVEVFESEHSRVLYYYLFGYGVPAIIVGVSAAVYSDGYGTDFHCWLTIERGFIWSFVGPVLAVLLVNVVMLGIAISTMVRHSSMSHTMRQKTVPQKMRTWLKGSVVLVVLLGLTWVFGVLYLDNGYHTLVFSYIFTLLNTLQGLFIFLFHCLFNEKVQKEYRRMIRNGSWCPTCLRTRYGYTSSSGSRENSSSGNVMARLFRGKRRHSGCGDSSNNSAKPFLHKEQRYLSSSNPSSSDGVASSRLSSETSNNNNRKLSHQSTTPSHTSDNRFLHPVEMSGIAGELSEILDCSVVDSEFVSEYCQQNMQVASETKRYSTSSEDSGGGDELEEESMEDAGESLDRLAALSVESLSKRQSHLISTSDLDEGEKKSEGGKDRGTTAVIESAPTIVRNPAYEDAADENEDDDDDDDDDDEETMTVEIDINRGAPVSPETQPLMIQQSESERVLIHNAANKPREKPGPDDLSPKHSPSLTHIPGPESKASSSTTPAHTSVPCLKFKSGHTALPPPAVRDAEKDDNVVNSLPDLTHTHKNGTALAIQIDSPGDTPATKRFSYDERAQFSPFRFSGSDC